MDDDSSNEEEEAEGEPRRIRKQLESARSGTSQKLKTGASADQTPKKRAKVNRLQAESASSAEEMRLVARSSKRGKQIIYEDDAYGAGEQAGESAAPDCARHTLLGSTADVTGARDHNLRNAGKNTRRSRKELAGSGQESEAWSAEEPSIQGQKSHQSIKTRSNQKERNTHMGAENQILSPVRSSIQRRRDKLKDLGLEVERPAQVYNNEESDLPAPSRSQASCEYCLCTLSNCDPTCVN